MPAFSTANASGGVCRPRHRERTSLYQLFDRNFDRFALECDERFEARHGPLRAVVRRVVGQCLECGRPEGGFARIRCPSCRGEHLLAFSYRAKRAALFAEHSVEYVLSGVPHRHVEFTGPKVVRGLFERERRLLSILPRCAHDATQNLLREATGDPRAQVGTVASIQTFGSYAANCHPHVHALVTAGAVHVDPSGVHAEFERVPWWDRDALGAGCAREVGLVWGNRRRRRSTEERRPSQGPSVGQHPVRCGGRVTRKRVGRRRGLRSIIPGKQPRAFGFAWQAVYSCKSYPDSSLRHGSPTVPGFAPRAQAAPGVASETLHGPFPLAEVIL